MSISVSHPCTPVLHPRELPKSLSWDFMTGFHLLPRTLRGKSITGTTPARKSKAKSILAKSTSTSTSDTPQSITPQSTSASSSPSHTPISAASTPGIDGLHSLTHLLHDGDMHVTKRGEWDHHDISQQVHYIQKQYENKAKMKERANGVRIQDKSEILDKEMLKKLFSMIPERFSLNAWQLRYSITRDGVAFSRFFERVRDIAGTIIIISDITGTVFGGYAPSTWIRENKEIYYGTGEAFVYRIHGTDIEIFNWSGKNDFYMLSSKTRIGMGGGGSFAWTLDTYFRNGSSGPCRTFESPCLASSHDFMCVMLEVWAPSGPMTLEST